MQILKLILAVLCLVCFNQCTSTAQQPTTTTLSDWDKEAVSNIRMWPKYKDAEKTPSQKEADAEFIESTMKNEQFKGDKRKASNHMIGLGFQYLYKGAAKTAMYRFNQAFLLDNHNPEIYWGYGAVYMQLSKFDEAKKMYETGLLLDPKNTNMLTDFGTYYIVMYQQAIENSEASSQTNWNNAIQKFKASYDLDPNNQNTSFKLSAAYYLVGDCKQALMYYNHCMKLGGDPIPEAYKLEMKNKCKG